MKTKKLPLLITTASLISSFLSSGCVFAQFDVLPKPIDDPNPIVEHEDDTNFTSDVASYYSACANLSGNALSSKLNEINKPKSKSYDWTRYEAADESLTDSTCILSLYTRHNIKKTSHCGDYGWDKWNREHIYVQSQYSESSTDNHNIFACEGQINGIRSDKKFGVVTHSDKNRVTVFGHTTDCYSDSKTFEPCDEAKGEVARALLYGSVTYGYAISGMINLQTCLSWNRTYSVTQREIKRNNKVYTLQGNRNPFVDNPGYATLIFGN